MSAKYFCDVCGEELSDSDRGKVKKIFGQLTVEVYTALDNTWNAGDFCHSCIIKAVNFGKLADKQN